MDPEKIMKNKEYTKNEIKSRKSDPDVILNKERKMIELVGFSSLPAQLCRKVFQRPFEFSILVVGGSGLGKSTLISSMFLTDIYGKEKQKKIDKTVTIETHKVQLEENGVKLNLTIIDTPGFGDAIDNTKCCDPIVEYVEKQFNEFLQSETSTERGQEPDLRVNTCLYFIAPSGHGLKRIDVDFMKRLHKKVNIIPVIGKADVLTKTELEAFKNMIMLQLKECDISLYNFKENIVNKSLPLAMIGSNTILENENGVRVRVRKYPWGTVFIEIRITPTSCYYAKCSYQRTC